MTLFYKSNGVTVTSVTFCKGVTDNEVTFLSNGVTDNEVTFLSNRVTDNEVTFLSNGVTDNEVTFLNDAHLCESGM